MFEWDEQYVILFSAEEKSQKGLEEHEGKSNMIIILSEWIL